jgi:excisionase family DNA binding protein
MFKIELKFKIDREVSWEKLATSFLAEAFRSAQNELRPKPTSVPMLAVLSRSVEEGKSQALRAVGVEEAARLLSISPHTVRSYVARRKISSVRIGRRVLIPMQVIDELTSKSSQPGS